MSARRFHADGAAPADGEVFVFGSNLSGYHGGGAARAAHQLYGAEWSKAEGHFGRTYAIPTVQHEIAGPLTVAEIAEAVDRFIAYATSHPELSFFVTRIGCGLAGHKDSDIAPMFSGAPLNCSLPDAWAAHIQGASL